MKRLTFIGENHSCPKCVKDEIALSKGSGVLAVEVIGYTRRNSRACEAYNNGALDVNELIFSLTEYSWNMDREFLLNHKPLFVEARKRKQRILPLRPWSPNDHYFYAEKYIGQYLLDANDLTAIVGSTCATGFSERLESRHPALKEINPDIRFLNVHTNNKHGELW